MGLSQFIHYSITPRVRRRRKGGYIEGTGRIQWGYSESTVGYSEYTVRVHWGTVRIQ